MLTIFNKEIKAYFNSLIAYIVIAVFLVFCSLIFWVYPGLNVLDFGFADMSSFFSTAPYVFMFLVPAICMRTFSEEYRTGTMEFLLTKPLSRFDIVWGKLAASWAICILALLPTVVYVFSLHFLGNPQGNLDYAAVVGSYLGLFLLVGAFCAVGIFASSSNSNQILSFILAAVILYLVYDGISSLESLFSGTLSYLFSYLGFSYHYESMSRGLLDFRDFVYFLSVIIVFVFLAKVNLDKKYR
jgi:ABC-2 type transport system permease protein